MTGIDKELEEFVLNHTDIPKSETQDLKEKLMEKYNLYQFSTTHESDIIELESVFVSQMGGDGWICTDRSSETLQFKMVIAEGRKYTFREKRISDPLACEYEWYESEMDYEDYTFDEIVSHLSPYGYSKSEIEGWMAKGDNIDLILECIFEQEY